MLSSITSLHGQSNSNKSASLQTKYVLQPEADRFRRRLGLRFMAPGREGTILDGALTLGAVRRRVQIVRAQDLAGEQVAVSFGVGKPEFVWTGASGALADGMAVVGEDKAMIERIVLDSADQFIQAQMRGASYITIGRSLRPEEAGSGAYAGPFWDVIMVTEPESAGSAAALSRARLYYINTATGLLDKVMSKENGEAVVAAFSGWTKINGELDPGRIQWSRKGQLIMELTFDNIVHGSKQ